MGITPIINKCIYFIKLQQLVGDTPINPPKFKHNFFYRFKFFIININR